ncbi:hypothetical protein HN928_07610 [bacterium]|nr:hypothetical protein [bacterium]
MKDEIVIRQTALKYNVPVITTISGAKATVNAIQRYLSHAIEVCSLQEFYK